MALLEVHNLHVHYGKIHALKGVSLSVDKDQIVTLIGANGAGKTTTLRAISGIIAASEGEVSFDGAPLGRMEPYDIVGRGVVQVPEGRRIFGRLTVEENLRIGAYLRNDRKAIAEAEERSLAMFPRLRERIHQVAGTLSGGEQQMLAMARGLMSAPKVLLLDEPSMGLAPILIEQISRRSRPSASRVCLCCLSSKMPFSRCRSPTTAMSSRPAKSCCTAMRRTCSRTIKSRKLIWADGGFMEGAALFDPRLKPGAELLAEGWRREIPAASPKRDGRRPVFR